MAGEKLGYVYGAFAGADLVGRENLFVEITGAAGGLPVVSIATDAEAADGVILRGDVKDATVRVCNEGIVMVKAGGVIAAADAIEVSGGKAVKATTGKVVGKALSSAVNGDVIPMMIYPGCFATVIVNHQSSGYTFMGAAAADLTGKEGIAVIIDGVDTNGFPIVKQATNALAIDGILLTGAAKDALVTVVFAGLVEAVAGAAITAGAAVEVASGKVVTKTAGVEVGKAVGAALDADDKILVLVK